MKREKEGYDISERADNYLNNPETRASMGLAWLAGMNDATIGILNLSLGTQKAANVSGTLWRDAAGTAASQPISGTFTITDITYGRVTFLAAAWANPRRWPISPALANWPAMATRPCL